MGARLGRRRLKFLPTVEIFSGCLQNISGFAKKKNVFHEQSSLKKLLASVEKKLEKSSLKSSVKKLWASLKKQIFNEIFIEKTLSFIKKN